MMSTSTLNMKCFVCNKQIEDKSRRNSFTSNSDPQTYQYSVMLFQILEIPHLCNDILKFENINYCCLCMNNISNIQNQLEELERQEHQVLHEKYKIESQLKENINNYKTTNNPTKQFQIDIANELKSNSAQSMLAKVRHGKVGRKNNAKCLDSKARILEDVEIPKLLLVPGNNQNPNLEKLPANRSEIFSLNSSDDSLLNLHKYESSSQFVINSPIHEFQQQSLPCTDNESYIYSSDEENIDLSLNGHEESMPFCSSDLNDMRFKANSEDPLHGRQDIDPFEGVGSSFMEKDNIHPVVITSEANTNISDDLLDYTESLVTGANSSKILKVSEGPILENQYICGICEENFDNYNMIEEHIKLHSRNKVQVNVGTKKFFTPANPKDQKRSWRSWPCNKPKKCEECGKILSSRRAWRLHVLRIHYNHSILQCPLCDYGCQRPNVLQSHMKKSHCEGRNIPSSLNTRTIKIN